MSWINYYDRQGRPITLDEAAPLLSDIEYKRVAADDVGPYWVSTVWLGLDHSFGPGPPLIFESMVFDSNSTEQLGEDLACNRYPTEHLALLGHFDLICEVQQAIDEGRKYDGYHTGGGELLLPAESPILGARFAPHAYL